jgi:uncharacterized membrane protein
MIRKKIFRLPVTQFKERGKEIHRVEALSDAVFAFSVSLLVASLEVPQTFHELLLIIKGALPFFATVAMIFLFWYQQYTYFRHYGLNDHYTIVLNLVYLAVILFYVYPLKFLFSLLIGLLTGINLFPHATETGQVVLLNEDFPLLIILFSAGYALIWFLVFLMYHRAYRLSGKLELNAWEMQFTRMERRGAAWNMGIGIGAILLSLAGLEAVSGMIYMMIPLVLIINKQVFYKKVRTLRQHG